MSKTLNDHYLSKNVLPLLPLKFSHYKCSKFQWIFVVKLCSIVLQVLTYSYIILSYSAADKDVHREKGRKTGGETDSNGKRQLFCWLLWILYIDCT